MRVRYGICSTLGVAILLLAAAGAPAQTWETAANHPGDDGYFDPPYPIVFVAAEIDEVPSGSGLDGNYHIGTDVLSANNPDEGHQLWVVLPGGAVVKLFPLTAHLPLIDTPPGDLGKGSVVEPNVSEDGTRIYFSYFHDTTFESGFSFGLNRLPLKGADLYVMDLAPLLANPAVDPATLPVTRLTTRVYGPGGQQTDADKYKDALNPTLATSGVNDWGTVYMHAVEMRTADGLVLVYASDERRVLNSNQSMSIGYANHNFNLHLADLAADGTLANHRQFQYYTTTSALSPTPLRNGIAFSYQASTAAARNWHIQGIDSAGRWYPILGYGTNPELFHLGAFCVNTKGQQHLPGDYFVGTRYYNANNEGFGALWAQDLGVVGVNAYDVQTFWGVLPRQVGSYKVTQQVNSNDFPAAKVNGQYVGKMTTPRCGRPDELYMAYSPTSANGRLLDPDGNRDIYRSYIAYRPNLEPFSPLDPVDVAAEQGLRIVVDDSSDAYTLVWPVPVLSWAERTGDPVQQHAPFIADPQTTVAAGMPHAQVGTSALSNTDRKPFDCWLGPMAQQNPYSPNKAYVNVNQENDLVVNNTDGLTFVQNQGDYCEPLAPAHVLGVAVNLTSNKTNMSAGFNPGYVTDGNGKKEAAKQLGVFDVRGQADQSFMAVIPAHAPFELQLLHKDYGLKLADVRSWHSLQPRETRSDCGGCHQHEPGQAIPFAGTVADQQPPLDLVTETPFLTYDPSCAPVVQTAAAASLDVPEWTAGVWPGFDQYCGGCHDNAVSTDPAALAALGYDSEEDAYNKLRSRNFADTKVGALGSPAFWAARGARTDGRDNDLAQYVPDYPSGVWGYRFSAGHAADPGLCDLGDPAAAAWVHRFGQWIDNHMPRDTGASFPYHHDWYHPSVDGALASADCSATQLRVGFWDDTGTLARIEVRLNGNPLATYTNQPNGAVMVALPPVVPSDAVEVVALDATDNRQQYEKSIGQLVRECSGTPPPTSTPVATATPGASATPVGTATVLVSATAAVTPVATATAPATIVPTATPTPGGGPCACTDQRCPADPARCRRCQHTIVKETSRLVRARVTALARCEDQTLKGQRRGDCARDPAVAARIARAEAKLAARIDRACGGDDRVCGGDLAGEYGAQADLGWPAACPNLTGGGCTQAIGRSDCTGVAACVGCIAARAVDEAMTLYYDALVPADPASARHLVGCQRAIGAATSRFLLAKEKALASCWKGRLRGAHTNDCPDPGDGKALRKIAAAEARKVRAICKACGGADGRCDEDVTTPSGAVVPGSGGTDDLAVATIGFVATCPDVQVPGGPACAGQVTTLADLVDCVDCVTELGTDCVDRARAQGMTPYPPECDP